MSSKLTIKDDQKLHHHLRKNTKPPAPAAGAKRSVKGRNGSPELRGSEAKIDVSARKLAAGLWHFAATSAGNGSGGSVKRQCGVTYPLLSWVPMKSAMEGATRREMSREDHSNGGLAKLDDSWHTATTSVVAPALQIELIKARSCIQELEVEKVNLRKRLKNVVRKLDEERAWWMRRERKKTHAVIDGLKDDLRRERRTCKRLEVVNSKLLVDLADSKLSSKRYMHDYEKERKYKESLEEACDELVKEIEEKRGEIEALKSGNARVDEEAEEERKMLQSAEVYREEQVQTKLIDAKLIFEEKYCLMSNLVSELESFLRWNNVNVDMMNGLSGVQEVKQVVDSFKMPLSNDMYTTTSTITNRCIGDSTRSHSSSTPQFVGNESKRCATNTSSECCSSRFLDQSCKDANAIDRGRETTGQSKKKGSSFRKLWTTSLLEKSGRHSNGSTDNVAERAVAYQDSANHCCSGVLVHI